MCCIHSPQGEENGDVIMTSASYNYEIQISISYKIMKKKKAEHGQQ